MRIYLTVISGVLSVAGVSSILFGQLESLTLAMMSGVFYLPVSLIYNDQHLQRQLNAAEEKRRERLMSLYS